MCKEVYYLYNNKGCFYSEIDRKYEDYIISTTNEDYIVSVCSKLNELEFRLSAYNKKLTNDEILSVIIDVALLQDKECNIVFNKENQI